MVIATIATAIGYAIDAGSGHKELTHVFAALYIAGCVVAVLVVRQTGVFTAVIQPPLILFCAVPGAYWLFHGGKIGSIKDLLINCGYPLIERFPMMLGTAGGVLLIGLIRWYFGMSHRTNVAADTADDAATATTTDAPSLQRSFFGGIAGKLNSILGLDPGDHDERADEAPFTDPARVHAGGPPLKSAARSSRSAARSTRSRSRHARPPLEDQHEPTSERPRRPSRRSQPPAHDFDPADAPRRARRRPRPEGDPDFGAKAPRETRRDPRTRRNPHERPTRSSRFDPYDRHQPPGAAELFRPFDSHESHEPYESYEQPRRRAAPNGPNGANPTHHPISRVRYRGSAPPAEPRADLRDEPHAERRSRSRASGRSQGRPEAEPWE